jgi:type II secretory pathway pseudopilin PulG
MIWKAAMNKEAQRRREARAGYSLVEVTLALLVVAIGLTATFALFPEGLRATRAAVDDTEISMFAEYVFTTLDLTAGKNGGNYGSGWTIGDTDEFISLMLSARSAASNYQLRAGGGVETFYWIPDYYGLSSGDYASGNFRDFWTSAFTYTLRVTLAGSGGVPTYAVLKVWPGENQGREEDARIFYREVLPIR